MSYVAMAYGIAVVVIGAYLWSVAHRRRAVERELESLDAEDDASRAAAGPEVRGARTGDGTPGAKGAA